MAASFLPIFTTVQIDPEWILQGVLPPLLYSAAVSMPAMNFRREFGAISGLSVLLVILTSLVLGLFFVVVIPDLGFAWGVALGAVISPTDAVATSIVKQQPVSQRVVAMLDGESLLNDATALVLLRTAIVTTAAAFSFWGALGTFGYSVLVAVVIGAVVGHLNLVLRRRATDPTASTVISFTVPFVAAVPAELLGASGLVAAVVAGLVTGIRAPRVFTPRNRLSDSQNWRTVELVLEGAVFLAMGVQLRAVLTEVEREHAGVGAAVLVAAGALVLTLLVRAAYVAPLLRLLSHRGRRHLRRQGHLEALQDKIRSPESARELLEQVNQSRWRTVTEQDLERLSTRIRRALANIEYFRREPLGPGEGSIIVWAGMRGAVTVAAVQTLPADTPQRSVLVLVAFAVALLSLVLQGGTIGMLVRLVSRPVDPAVEAAQTQEEVRAILTLLQEATAGMPKPAAPREGFGQLSHEDFEEARTQRLAVLEAQRSALLDARDDGTFDANVLADMLATLDAAQVELETRGRLAS